MRHAEALRPARMSTLSSSSNAGVIRSGTNRLRVIVRPSQNPRYPCTFVGCSSGLRGDRGNAVSSYKPVAGTEGSRHRNRAARRIATLAGVRDANRRDDQRSRPLPDPAPRPLNRLIARSIALPISPRPSPVDAHSEKVILDFSHGKVTMHAVLSSVHHAVAGSRPPGPRRFRHRFRPGGGRVDPPSLEAVKFLSQQLEGAISMKVKFLFSSSVLESSALAAPDWPQWALNPQYTGRAFIPAFIPADDVVDSWIVRVSPAAGSRRSVARR
jgi:hypothetical protein